MVNVR